jgi:hypothetical protein
MLEHKSGPRIITASFCFYLLKPSPDQISCSTDCLHERTVLRKIIPAHNASGHRWYVIVLFLCMEVVSYLHFVLQNFRSKVIMSFYDSVGAVSSSVCALSCLQPLHHSVPYQVCIHYSTQSRNLVDVNSNNKVLYLGYATDETQQEP